MSFTKSNINDIIYQVNGAAIEVHKFLGSGLLESTYHKCMKRELEVRNMSFTSEMRVPIDYKGLNLLADLRCDLFVEGILPVELKAVVEINYVHEAQLLTYMRLLKVPKGLLINFNCQNIFKNGQRTFVNELYRNLG